MERTVSSSAEAILADLRAQASPQNVAGMARFGINPQDALGITVKALRDLDRITRKQLRDPLQRHALAAVLWESQIHEARILASMLDEPALVTPAQMDAWAADFNSWDLVDQVCGNLFDKTLYGYAKAIEWSDLPEEYVRRAGFSLMAYITSHIRPLPDPSFEPFLNAILKHACDERNYVKKAVSWALRGIGKRSPSLNQRALEVAHQLAQQHAPAARWVARDALKELTSEAVQRKLGQV